MNRLLLKEYTNGKKYLCQTIRENWEEYLGSGLDVTDDLVLENTVLLGTFENKEDLAKSGMYYSMLWNVVESNIFLNRTMETGQGGHTTYTPERNKKISEALTGKPKSAEHRKKLSQSKKNQVTAYNKITDETVVVTPEQFRECDYLVGVAVKNKGQPKSEEWKEKRRGIPVSEETRAKLRGKNPKKAMTGSRNGMSKEVVVFGNTYESIAQAARDLGRNTPWICRRLDGKKYPDCYRK